MLSLSQPVDEAARFPPSVLDLLTTQRPRIVLFVTQAAHLNSFESPFVNCHLLCLILNFFWSLGMVSRNYMYIDLMYVNVLLASASA